MTVHSPSADDSVEMVEENIAAGNEFDNGQALQEGWGVFDCAGSDNGPWQIQKCDDSTTLTVDEDAWRLVSERADAGSAHHASAIEFIRANNPIEYDALQAFKAKGMPAP